jgi:hypothetical protein
MSPKHQVQDQLSVLAKRRPYQCSLSEVKIKRRHGRNFHKMKELTSLFNEKKKKEKKKKKKK